MRSMGLLCLCVLLRVEYSEVHACGGNPFKTALLALLVSFELSIVALTPAGGHACDQPSNETAFRNVENVFFTNLSMITLV